MKVDISIPDDLTQALTAGATDLPRFVIEAVALRGYRDRRLSEYQVQQLLQLSSRFEVHAFLKEHDVPLNYSMKDLLQDIETSRAVETAEFEGNSNAA